MDPNQQPSPAPQAPSSSPYPQPAQPPAGQIGEDPGRTLGIIGFICIFVVGPVIGLIICIIANNQSKKAGYTNSLAKAGIWVSAVLLALLVLFFILLIIGSVAASSH